MNVLLCVLLLEHLPKSASSIRIQTWVIIILELHYVILDYCLLLLEFLEIF